jgi:hypothetical protein
MGDSSGSIDRLEIHESQTADLRRGKGDAHPVHHVLIGIVMGCIQPLLRGATTQRLHSYQPVGAREVKRPMA